MIVTDLDGTLLQSYKTNGSRLILACMMFFSTATMKHTAFFGIKPLISMVYGDAHNPAPIRR